MLKRSGLREMAKGQVRVQENAEAPQSRRLWSLDLRRCPGFGINQFHNPHKAHIADRAGR